MNYSIKTLSQLRLILQGFRKTNRLTQAALADKLGITQQSYAQLEANPAAASVDRLFRVLQVLGVDLVLSGDAPFASGASYASATATPGQQDFAASQLSSSYAPGGSGEPTQGKSVKGSAKKAGPARATAKKKESW
ncbi:helix-turn-helix transcriptional regulator [Collimonas sp.]|jgi:HTH-type transcriptional regulator/antitoxin HipB|uniref:helix-turn-helix transcriptional regulator n=1 Tax=Collimonas sp. TaxID=1963772 RepID=UPI002C6658DD|nr:helix-turn-helix transcriptional regulator [Collimonas sp.]HWW05775.1 helix-turn-helix transcriptional regulator [Collimonas sp.]